MASRIGRSALTLNGLRHAALRVAGAAAGQVAPPPSTVPSRPGRNRLSPSTHGREGHGGVAIALAVIAAVLDDVADHRHARDVAADRSTTIGAAAGRAGDQGGERGGRRYRGHAALRHRLHPGPRAADHLADRQGIAAEQAAHHPARRAGAERAAALGDHASADARRRLSLLRGRREGLGSWSEPEHEPRRGRRRAEQRRSRARDGRAARSGPTSSCSAEIMAIALAEVAGRDLLRSAR